jgi:hypothetical protein
MKKYLIIPFVALVIFACLDSNNKCNRGKKEVVHHKKRQGEKIN